MKSLLFFDSMITPRIITFIYWLLLFAALIGGIGAMFTFGRLSFSGFATGLAIIAGGALGARVWCELLMVLFKINEHTHKMAERP
ncbi:MAG: DUF4282 domain-containing protein [Ideonella sp.]|nr:DUF4282 domain-containing protein [Ideonella sp.]MCC7456515.1 DUF4282 domain-containing protein [Nitrospira sp.]